MRIRITQNAVTICGGGRQAARGRNPDVTAIIPRIRMPRLDAPRPLTRVRTAIVRRHQAMPRPPAYVILCATIGVLNIVGLVMILSASSVAALSDYGSSWYFFDRQLVWAIGGAAAFVVASNVDYHVWRRLAPWLFALSVAGLLVVLVPGSGSWSTARVVGSARAVPRAAERGREAGAALLRRQRAGPPG
jgi:cell division protein FtsW